jgi:uncharacterized membrane protein YagU involved in acid resistance
MNYKTDKVVIAGIAGTAIMTATGLWGAPLMGLPKMNPANMLAAQMGGVALVGWAAHFMIGVVLTFGYAMFAAERLPGPPAVRGILFSIAPWLMAQLVVMPMMGMPLFSGSTQMAIGSLIGHAMFGAAIGSMLSSTD